MNLAEMLEKLRKEALADPGLRERLLDTRKEKAPLSAFCSLCRELGYPIYEMDLIQEGEEFYASMRRSTNGGGENSRCWKERMIFMNFSLPVLLLKIPGLTGKRDKLTMNERIFML
ncbi:MAG: hypothetical protein ACLR2E_04155 [Lachnospiraceae bacterium]